MSATEDKNLSKPREDGDRARRAYASLQCCRGFQRDDGGAPLERRVSIKPMMERTYWRHVGGGQWNATDALYEKVDE